jgi:biofilm PGA synthesis N-glycosyltransferase PgaC
MIILLELSLAFVGIAFAIYVSYSILVLRTKKKEKYIQTLHAIIEKTINPEDLPNVTVFIPTYNEEKTIYTKIKNVSEFNYPHNKIHVLIADDNSSDKTREIVQSAFKDFNLAGHITQNENRKGVNVSYNRVIPNLTSKYILTTDADAIIPPDSLLKAIKILAHLKDVGAVAAKMTPIHDKTTAATRTAVIYADSYNLMLIAESSIYSTFPGSTSCMLMRKSAFSPISTSYGSSDGNISLSFIKKGFKFILAPCISYYEPISQKIFEQRRQKIRRASRLIQSTLLNADMLFSRKYKEFGKTIFPLRMLMMTLSPILVLSAFLLFFAYAFVTSQLFFGVLLVCTLLVIVLGIKTNIKMLNFLMSFLIHQVYLFIGFILSYKKITVWEKIERR